jgi:hypothetical protein
MLAWVIPSTGRPRSGRIGGWTVTRTGQLVDNLVVLDAQAAA